MLGLIGYWLYILPAGSPGSYSLSHTGDAYLGLHSLNGEGLNIAPSLQPQVCTEDSCRVDLNAVNPATQNPWIHTLSLAPFDLDLSSDPILTLPLTPSIPPPIQTDPSLLCTVSPEELIASLKRNNVRLFKDISICIIACPSIVTCTHSHYPYVFIKRAQCQPQHRAPGPVRGIGTFLKTLVVVNIELEYSHLGIEPATPLISGQFLYL